MLIEPTQLINLGTKEHPHMIHLAQSVSLEEKEKFIAFFQEKKIKFPWTYLDVLGLDLDLIMYHFSIALGIKPVK